MNCNYGCRNPTNNSGLNEGKITISRNEFLAFSRPIISSHFILDFSSRTSLRILSHNVLSSFLSSGLSCLREWVEGAVSGFFGYKVEEEGGTEGDLEIEVGLAIFLEVGFDGEAKLLELNEEGRMDRCDCRGVDSFQKS